LREQFYKTASAPARAGCGTPETGPAAGTKAG